MACDATYQGPSCPRFHGTKCERSDPHPGERHLATVEGLLLLWWTEEEKRSRRLEKQAK